MKFQPILLVVGILLLALGGLMVAPAVMDYMMGDPAWEAFAESAGLTLLIGGLFVLANRSDQQMELSIRETFILTTASWLFLSIFAALPFFLTTVTASNTDSLFEAISALTTTGATVITGLDYAPLGVLLWRALLQWLGGIGIIVMAMTVLPALSIGGMQLFRSEFSDRSEKILPRVSQITKAIFWTYLGLTFFCMIGLRWSGLGWFDAICHSMTTVSTGGMGNYDDSIGVFKNLLAENIIIFFMILGAVPFILQVRFLNGDSKVFWHDSQTRLFLTFVFCIPFFMSLWRWWTSSLSLFTAFRETFFNVVSVMTITGFNTGDYNSWAPFGVLVLFVLLFIGGCTGSTSGGVKVFRIKIVLSVAMTHIQKLYKPHSIRVPTYNGQEITDKVYGSVVTFLTLFIASFTVLAIGLSFTGLDFLTSISGSAAILTNLGPGFGFLIGPKGTYMSLPDTAKWMMMAGMIMGRLELITVIILFRPSFWRK